MNHIIVVHLTFANQKKVAKPPGDLKHLLHVSTLNII